MFANGINVLITDNEVGSLQNKIDRVTAELETWFNRNDLVINAGKTGIMSFHNRQTNFLVKPQATFNKINLDYTAEKKFLGIHITETLKWKMVSPLSPVIANFFMEDFEERALNQATLKPTCWYRYVDDTFVIWPHGKTSLTTFLEHLNGLHNNIQFTMEIEENGRLPFLDIDLYKKGDGSLGHKVYRKPTHTDLYLHQLTHQHPANKHSVLSSLIQRAQPYVIKIPSHRNWNSSPPYSSKMVTMTIR